MLVRKRSHVVSLIPKSRGSTSVRYLLWLYLVHFSSAPLLLYAILVAHMSPYPYLSGGNNLTQAGKDTVTRAWEAAGKESGSLYV